MDRTEFLRVLEGGLVGVSPDERVAAMQYYTEYFDDAGPEREAEVLEELGDPGKIASEIQANSGDGESFAPPPKAEKPAAGVKEQTTAAPQTSGKPADSDWNNVEAAGGPALEWNTPFEPSAPRQSGPAATPQAAQPQPGNNTQTQPPPQGAPYTGHASAPTGTYVPLNPPQGTSAQTQIQGNNSIAKIILIILLAVLLAPLWGGLLGAFIGIFVSLVVVLCVPIIVGIAFVASSIAIIVLGGTLMPATVPSGLVALGIGVLLLGLGLLLIYLGGWLLGKVLPAIFRGIASLFRKIFH